MEFAQFLSRQRSKGRKPRLDYSRLANFGKENIFAGEKAEEEKSTTGRPQSSVKLPEVPESDKKTAKQAGKRKRKRVLVDQNRLIEIDEEPQSEFELQRAERMKRNQEFIRQLELKRYAHEFQACMQRPAPDQKQRVNAKPRPPREKPAVNLLPARQSSRQRGINATDGTAVTESSSLDTNGNPDHAGVETCQEYFRQRGQNTNGFEVNGTFTGWVNPEICERYGIANSADAAWEANGGGKFTFKIDKKAIPSHLKSRGWSDARAFSHTQLQKNPNAYFYRHVAPHEQQAQGDWTEEEHEVFLDTARKYGSGDKWGLFSSYVPQRVGYQCSAYYREVVIPRGLIYDPKYRITKSGKAVYVG